MLKPVNNAARNVVEQKVTNGRCGDVCVLCDEPYDNCNQCDSEPCLGGPDLIR